MLRKIRIALATFMMLAVTLLLIDYFGIVHRWLGWVAKVQLLPAILAMNLAIVAALAVITLVFGRIYCSVICPLGIMQDLFSSANRKPNHFGYSREHRWLRYGMLAVMVVALLGGLTAVVSLLAPYSAYGRIVTSLLQPLWLWGNNALAAVAAHYESYAFYSVEVWLKSGITLAVAIATVVVLAVLAWKHGRTYCNTICPVGTLLSLLSRFSWFKVYIDEERCISCGKCGRNCKAACIDTKNHRIDYSRCVVCGNCIEKCSAKALIYGHPRRGKAETAVEPAAEDSSTNLDGRRAFLIGATIAAADMALAQAGKKVDGGLAVLQQKKAPHRTTPITPPGSMSAANMAAHCTACQLCVSKCPNQVLRPSSDPATLMQPVLSYDHGYCRPECTRCSNVCPTGAIRPLDRAAKSSVQIGHAVWLRDNCIVLSDGVACGNCARHCPSGAITMVASDPNDDLSPMVPAVDASRCIGCGACEWVCPARPFPAIYVEGHEQHRVV